MVTYSMQVQWSDEDQAFIATCPEFPDISAFGADYATVTSELVDAIELAVQTYREENWPLPAPEILRTYSGQLRARLPKSLHARLAARARVEGVSLNTLIVAAVAASLGQPAGDSTVENVR